MYTSVSDDFIEAIQDDARTFRAKIVCGDTEITEGFISVVTKGSTGTSTDAMELGTAVATTLTATMAQPSIPLTGKEISLHIGIVLAVDDTTGEEEVEYVPMGVFVPEKPTVSGGQITFTAYDFMSAKLNKTYLSELSYPCDVEEVCIEIEEMTGIEILDKPTGYTIYKRVDSSSDSDSTATNYSNPFDGYTFKDAVGMIAGIYGKYATMNRYGKVEFRYFTSTDFSVATDASYSDINVSEEAFILDYINVSIASDTALTKGEGSTGISYSDICIREEQLDILYEELNGFTFYPTTVSFKGDLRLDLGDIITVYKLDGTSVDAPIMGLTFTFDGGLKTAIGSYGSTEASEATYVSPTELAITRVYQQLVAVEELIVNKTITVGDIADLAVGYTNLINTSKTLVNTNYRAGVPLCNASGTGLCTVGGIQLITG